MTKEHQDLKDALHDWCGFDLTPEQLEEIASHPEVRSSLVIGGVDTVTRETAACVLAQKLLGRPWPTYGDGPSDAFFRDLEEAAAKQGYKLGR